MTAELTKDNSKFAQMAGEARTALNMWKNTGTWTGIGKIPVGLRICVICGSAATEAEHLVNKAHGGNHTPNNVIPVCKEHKKKGKYWINSYTPDEQRKIIDATTVWDSERLNPYVEENDAKFQELRDLVNSTVNQWRKENEYWDQ